MEIVECDMTFTAINTYHIKYLISSEHHYAFKPSPCLKRV